MFVQLFNRFNHISKLSNILKFPELPEHISDLNFNILDKICSLKEWKYRVKVEQFWLFGEDRLEVIYYSQLRCPGQQNFFAFNICLIFT